MKPIQKQGLRIAVLDLYNGVANQGMRCIREMLLQLRETQELEIDWDEFNVRQKNELPDLTYDIFISSGGPGSPLKLKALNGKRFILDGSSKLSNGTMKKKILGKNIFSLFVIPFNWHAGITKSVIYAKGKVLHLVFFQSTY